MAAAPPPARKSRITVVETVHHTVEGLPTVTSDNRYGRWSPSDAQAVSSKGNAGTDWSALPRAAPGPARALVLRNEAGMRGHAQPSDVDLSGELAAFIIEVAVAPPGGPGDPVAFATLGPGESLRLSPTDLGAIRVRCRAGTAPYQALVVPE